MTRAIQLTIVDPTYSGLKVVLGLTIDKEEQEVLREMALKFYDSLSSFLHNPESQTNKEEAAGGEIEVYFDDDVEEEEEEWEDEDEDEGEEEIDLKNK